MPTTIQDIANRLGISKSTVSKGLNNATDISEEMRRKILDTAVEMGYLNNRVRKQTRTICIIINNMDYDTPSAFGYDIVLGFKQMAEPDGWNVEIRPISNEFEEMITYEEFMVTENYHGAFILGFSMRDPWLKQLESTQFPTVLFDNYVKSNPHIASITCDNQEGLELAVKHLKELGHTKIGYISGPPESYIINARYQSFLSAMNKYGLEVHTEYLGFEYNITDSVRNNVTRMHDLGVTAILFSHDIRAVAALTECIDHGIRVPQDLCIIGFDDLPMTAYTDPSITTIRQDRISLGKTAYYAISCLSNQIPIGSIQLRAPLIVRNSTCPVSDQ